jgi:uncharacterized glyoxalase superfamily protein PhnB
MAQNPPEGFPRITPYLLYEDVDAALDWLIGAFGFTERVRMKGPDGKANHAEISIGDGVVMMGHPGPDQCRTVGRGRRAGQQLQQPPQSAGHRHHDR